MEPLNFAEWEVIVSLMCASLNKCPCVVTHLILRLEGKDKWWKGLRSGTWQEDAQDCRERGWEEPAEPPGWLQTERM